MSIYRWGLPFLIVGLATCGCSDSKSVKLLSVSGKVTLENVPLTAGVVTFTPDTSKGNSQQAIPSGTIDDQGVYRLQTSDVKDMKDGAPVGWYKVSVNTSMPSMNPTKGVSINVRYTNPATSGLAVEVVASPAAGAYDLKLTK